MLCPACNIDMAERGSADVIIDECESCGGIWFDAGELKQYLAQHGATSDESRAAGVAGLEAVAEAGPARTCPRCGKARTIDWRWRGAAIARCDSCRGVFVDAEALASLTRGDPAAGERDTPGKAVRETLLHTLGELAMAVFDMS